MGKKCIFKFVNIYGIKYVTYFKFDEDGKLNYSDYFMLGEFDEDIYEKRIRETFAKNFPNIELIIERLDKIKK